MRQTRWRPWLLRLVATRRILMHKIQTSQAVEFERLWQSTIDGMLQQHRQARVLPIWGVQAFVQGVEALHHSFRDLFPTQLHQQLADRRHAAKRIAQHEPSRGPLPGLGQSDHAIGDDEQHRHASINSKGINSDAHEPDRPSNGATPGDLAPSRKRCVKVASGAHDDMQINSIGLASSRPRFPTDTKRMPDRSMRYLLATHR